MFEGSKLPLTTWFLAMSLLTGSKTNMSALELKQHLGVCYETAWKPKHKVIQVMTEREAPGQLSDFVQIDDAYLGGERDGGKSGHATENKQPFVVAVVTSEMLEPPTFAAIESVRSFDNPSRDHWGKRRLASGAEVFSFGLGCLRRVIDRDHAHNVLETAGGRAANGVKGARWWTWCSVKSDAPSAAATPCGKPSTCGDTWPRRLTAATVRFASPSCRREGPAPWCCASLGQSRNCVPSTTFMAERRR